MSSPPIHPQSCLDLISLLGSGQLDANDRDRVVAAVQEIVVTQHQALIAYIRLAESAQDALTGYKQAEAARAARSNGPK